MNAWTKGTWIYNLSEVKFKFLGDKKGPTKGFYLEVWKIDSVFFLSSLSFEPSQLFLYIWRFVLMGIARDSVNLKEIEIWSWIAAVNHF